MPDEVTTEFGIARKSLIFQSEKEVINLKNYLNSISDDDIRGDDSKILGDAVLQIFLTGEGLKRLAGVMEYIDLWEENGDPPQLSYIDDHA